MWQVLSKYKKQIPFHKSYTHGFYTQSKTFFFNKIYLSYIYKLIHMSVNIICIYARACRPYVKYLLLILWFSLSVCVSIYLALSLCRFTQRQIYIITFTHTQARAHSHTNVYAHIHLSVYMCLQYAQHSCCYKYNLLLLIILTV